MAEALCPLLVTLTVGPSELIARVGSFCLSSYLIGGTYAIYLAKSQHRKKTIGIWMNICSTVYPTRSRALSFSIPRRGSIQNGLTRFGKASAAL
jgi:hypothetical protein